MIVEGIISGELTIEEIEAACHHLKDTKIATVLEAIEEISNKKLMNLSVDYLAFAKKYILSKGNFCKRESSRIVGN